MIQTLINIDPTDEVDGMVSGRRHPVSQSQIDRL
jgi:hypothetical protein